MAIVLRVANKGQTITESLLDVLQIRPGGWTTVPSEGLVTETFNLVLQGTDSQIIAATNDMDELRRKVAQWFDDMHRTESIWLEINATGESAKRALIYGMEFNQQTASTLNPLLGRNAQLATLIIDRHPLWENVAQSNYTTTTVSCLGGKWTPSVAEGSAAGRIAEFIIKGESPSLTPIRRFWAGILPDLGSGHTNFDPVIELEDGTAYNGGSLTTRSGASGGEGLYVASIASTKTLYGEIYMNDHQATDQDEYVGDYLVLARCKVDTGTVGVTLGCGTAFTAEEEVALRNMVQVSNTSWQLIELGEITLPPYGIRQSVGSGSMDYVTLQIYAEQLTGTSELDVDCLILIPTKHMIYIDDTDTYYDSVSRLEPTYCYTYEDEENDCVNYRAGTPARAPDRSFLNWYWPPGGGTIVLAGQRSSSHDLTDVVSLEMNVNPRWHNFRES